MAHLGWRLSQHTESLLVSDLSEVFIVNIEDLVTRLEAAVLGCCTIRIHFVDDYSTLQEYTIITTGWKQGHQLQLFMGIVTLYGL